MFLGRLDMIGNNGLPFFYVTGLLRENVYYHAPSDTYVIADHEGQHIFLHNVFSGTLTDLSTVLGLFGRDVEQVTLGFTPSDGIGLQITELHEEDCTLFIKGDALHILEQEKLRIPSLAHA